MNKNFDINGRQTVTYEDKNFFKNVLTKSYTSLHPKKNLPKNQIKKNPLKKPKFFKQKKYSKTSRIHFSDKKEKNLGYLLTNPISSKDKNIEINNIHLNMNNIPSSSYRLNKFNKGLEFNIKKHKSNNIMRSNIKSINNEEKFIEEKNINNENNISINNSDINSKKANEASSKNNNKNNIILNNSLIHSSENFMNTIAMTLSNNKENNIKSNKIRFYGLNSIGFGWSISKGIRNINNFSIFNSRNKIQKKLQEKNSKIIKNKKDIKDSKNQDLNIIKNNKLYKTKSKAKIKFNDSKNKKKNYNKKIQKSSTNIANNIIINTNINSNNNKQSNTNIINLPLDESDKIKINIESNTINNINSDNSIINKDLVYETIVDNHFKGDIINNNFNFLNIINTSNKRNIPEKEELNAFKTLNTMKSYLQSSNISNDMNMKNSKNIINSNINIIETNIINNIESSENKAYQTYSGPFRQNIIKVNLLDKAKMQNKKMKSVKSCDLQNSVANNNEQKAISKNNKETKSANNLINNIIDNNIIEEDDDKISLYVSTDIHSKNKITRFNLKNNIINIFNQNDQNEVFDESSKSKNITITNNSSKKIEFKLNDQKIDYNKKIKNNIKQNRLINSLICSQNLYSEKSSTPSSALNSLNYNLYSLTKDKNRCYIKKKSSVSNINDHSNNGNQNLTSNTNRSSAVKHKKNYSLSSNIYNTQRTIIQNRLDLKNKNNKNSKNKQKHNLYFSPKNKSEIFKGNKSIEVPEYTIKLEKIKSRVSNLLNVYSLLAIKSINDNDIKENSVKQEFDINGNGNEN